MSNAKKEITFFEKALSGFLRKIFPQYHHLFKIVTMKRSLSKDSSLVWAMDKKKIPEICDIYFQEDYICEINESMKPNEVEALLIKCLNDFKNNLEARGAR